MHLQRRDFLLVVTLAVGVVTPAFGQTVAPTVQGGTQNRASVPDFSGAWTKPYIGIESPSSGPGPVTNRRVGMVGGTSTGMSAITQIRSSSPRQPRS